MKCPYPMEIKNKLGYLAEVPCGHCVACRLNRAREWSQRIMNELAYHKDACFLTLTYDDEHLPEDNSLSKRDFQLFMKRFRKDFGLPVRFFACGEYGKQTFRPHYHVIFFGVSPTSDLFLITGKSKSGFWCDLSSWDKGHCFVGDVTFDSACYVAKYCAKELCENNGKVPLNNDFYSQKGVEPPFLLMSRRPGIGAKYVRDYKNRLQVRQYVIGKGGVKCPLPRFYRDKIEDDAFIYRKTWKGVFKEVALYQRAKSLGKDFYQFKDEILQCAEDVVKSLLQRKGVKDNEI